MTMSLIERDGKTFTRFMVPIKNLKYYKHLLAKYVDIKNPTKKNSRFIYYECEGDLLNGKDAIV